MARATICTAFVVLLLLAACGDRRDGPAATASSGDRATADATPYVAEVLSGTVASVSATGASGTMVVYGGRRHVGPDDRAEVVDRGVVVDHDGVRTTFSIGARLVDTDLAAVGDRVVVTGRRCRGEAQVGDTGVACSPGTATVVVVDPATGDTTALALPTVRADPDGLTLFLEAHTVGDRLVVRVVHADGVETLVADGELTSLVPLTEDPRSGPACATGSSLVEARPSAEGDQGLPLDPNEWDDTATEPVVLRFLDPDSGSWAEGAPSPPVPLATRHLTCTTDHASVVVADPGGTVRALVYDREARSWSDVELPTLAGPVTTITDAIADQVLVVDALGEAARLTPSTSATSAATAPEELDGSVPIVAIGGDRFAVLGPGPPPALEPIG